MGSEAHVVVVGGSDCVLDLARRQLGKLEALWSRFKADSEVSVLNHAAGCPVGVSPETRILLERARAGRELTGGLFDPLVLDDLCTLGYDRSFEQLAMAIDPVGSGGCGASDKVRSEWSEERAVFVDDGQAVHLLPGTGFDPGGIGKGLAADLLVAELLDSGADGASVNVGGDVRVEGRAPTADGWVIAVEDPWSPGRELARCALRSGAVATSSRCDRTWRRGGVDHHHLIDPRTGRSAMTGLSAVTVVAGEGWLAEVVTKAAFLAGVDGALEIVRRTGTAAWLVADDGEVQYVGLPGGEDAA